MEQNDYLSHLADISDILKKRTKFHALSGVSGMLAGTYALIGAFVARSIIYSAPNVLYDDIRTNTFSPDIIKLAIVFGLVLVAALSTGFYFSSKKAQKDNEKLFSAAAFGVLKNLSIPLVVGAVFVIVLYFRGYYDLMAATSLAFYGLALFAASNYTFSEIRALSLAVMATAMVSMFFPGYGLLFWAIGFGILHIVYGLIMYLKYDR